MKITCCIGSSCHIKGSREVVEALQNLIAQHHLEDKVSLGAAFCMGHCQQGVSVQVEDCFYSVSPSTVSDFFTQHILTKVG